MRTTITGIIFLFLSIAGQSQPSGGPYGPVSQTYELPAIEGRIYYVAPDGDVESSGESLEHPTTIENAIKKVGTGDAIILRGGVYRTGDLVLNQGITIQPYNSEQPVFKGTQAADDWEDLKNGLWVTSWSSLFPMKPADWWNEDKEGRRTPLHRFNNDMVFIDGQLLQSAGWEGEVDENSFFINYEEQKVFIGTNPEDKLVEITAYDVCIHRTTEEVHGKTSDGKGLQIRGITFAQYAYRALEFDGTNPDNVSPETDHGKEVTGTTIEHCHISYCSRVAAYLRGDNLTVRHCEISNTSTEGLFILSSSDVLLERNIFRKNNIEQITGYYPAAVKIFNQCYRVTCNDNLVIDHPHSNGIWYDVGNVDGIFTNNWLQNVGDVEKLLVHDKPWPSNSGFFFEISKGAICAGNVFLNCDQGIFVLNSSDVKMYNNTLVNSTVAIGRNGRVAEGDRFGWHADTGPGVFERDGHEFVNNLLSGIDSYKRPMLHVWQKDTLCDLLPDPFLKELDHNVFTRFSKLANVPLYLWSPAENDSCQTGINSPEEMNKMYSGFSANSMYFFNNESVFKSAELSNLTLLPEFPGLNAGTKLPSDIVKVIGSKNKNMKYVGAYPPDE